MEDSWSLFREEFKEEDTFLFLSFFFFGKNRRSRQDCRNEKEERGEVARLMNDAREDFEGKRVEERSIISKNSEKNY